MHIEGFTAAGAQIVGVSDTSGCAAKIASELGCAAFEEPLAMIEATSPDFIMAMARHVDMPDLARLLLESGIPFGIEKPLGLSAKMAAPVVDLMRMKGAFAAVPLVNRYSRIWEMVHGAESPSDGGVGPGQRTPPVVSHAHFRVVNGSPERYEKAGVGWMLDPLQSGGGALRNLGIHGADAFLMLTEKAPYVVKGAAVHGRIHRRQVEEFGTILLESESGAIATVEAGYSYATRDAGGDFELRIALADRYLIDRDATLTAIALGDPEPRISANRSQGDRYREFARDTLERLAAGRPPIADLEDCYDAMLLIDRAYEKAEAAR